MSYQKTNLIDRLFSGKVALSIIKAHLREKLVYRFDLIVGLIRVFIALLVFRYLWVALYSGQETYAGVTLKQTLTYTIISIILRPLFQGNSAITEVSQRIRTGNIVFDIARPVYYGDLLLFQAVGKSIAAIIFSSLPLFGLALLLLDLQLPTSYITWIAFLISLMLGYITAFLIDFILSLFGFWVTNVSGFLFAKWNIIDLLGGIYIPLWFFPPSLKNIAMFLPFRGISYTPVAIFVNYVDGDQVLNEFGLQIAWISFLFFISRLIYISLVKKLEVQGG